MPRSLRPRATSALVIAPITVTDRTCAAVLGIEPRTFREWLVDEKIEHRRIGRRVIARVDHVLAALSLTPVPASKNDGIEGLRDDLRQTADDVLARIGRRRSA